MKKVIFFILISGISIFVAIYLYKHHRFIHQFTNTMKSPVIEEDKMEPVLARFSFQSGTPNCLINSYRHFKVRIYDIKNWKVDRRAIGQIADSIPLLITIETRLEKVIPSFEGNLLEEITKGRFDEEIQKLCSQFVGTRTNVYFRFDPEMEVPVNGYPWQQYGGMLYIDAFRHFASLCKIYAPQVKQMWGPAGYPGAMEYYPGDDLVDAASVTIKSESEKSLKVYPTNYDIAYDLFRRLHRLRFINKPVFVLGSRQIEVDSVDEKVISFINHRIDEQRAIAYSEENFIRKDSILDKNQTGKFEFGLYDPQSLLNNEKPVTVEHLFADFGNLNDGTFQEAFRKVVQRGHHVIVTFEPFRNPSGKIDLHVLQNVFAGKYDKPISQLYSILMSTDQIVYLRYAHEMEIPITRYPWQSQDPVDYILSFRYFMTFQHPQPQNIRRVWGPAGDRGSLEWWPGNDVVDFISMAIYGLPDKNITDPEKQESFSTIFNRKFWRFRFVDKPIFITEFGVKGPENFQTQWLVAAAKVIRENPQVVGINYFNMTDTPQAWGEIKPPDWSISKVSFYTFLQNLKEK